MGTANFSQFMNQRQKAAKHVSEVYEEGAKHFEAVGETYFEILQMGESDCIAFWTGIQHATTLMKGSRNPAPQDLRVTEVFKEVASGS